MILKRSKEIYAISVLVLIGLSHAFQSQAQDFEIGLSAGLGSSEAISHYDDEIGRYNSPGSFGFHVGPTVQLNMGKRFALGTSFLYNRKGYGYTFEEGNERLHFLTVPVMLKWYFLNSRIRGFLGAGVYGASLMNARASIAGGPVPTTNVYKGLDAGVRASLGVEYKFGEIVAFSQVAIDEGIADLSEALTSYVTLRYASFNIGFRVPLKSLSGSSVKGDN
jgi:hypothetical protein